MRLQCLQEIFIIKVKSVSKYGGSDLGQIQNAVQIGHNLCRRITISLIMAFFKHTAEGRILIAGTLTIYNSLLTTDRKHVWMVGKMVGVEAALTPNFHPKGG